MRVSTDSNDPAYIDDRPRRVWCQDRLVEEPWLTADEFRRCVVLASGKVMNGAVLIERLPDDPAAPVPEVAPQAPINTGFSGGMFVATPDKKQQQHGKNKRRR